VSYFIYQLFAYVGLFVATPFVPLLLLTRHGRGLGERLCFFPPSVRALRRPLWVHAASVGEVLAAEPLIREIRRHEPEAQVLLTTTTISGRETARARSGATAVMLLPLDVTFLMRRVIREVSPRALLVVETEIWPALFRVAAKHRVPIAVVSGRLSERAAARYAWIRTLLRPALRVVRLFTMQTQADADRIIALGAPPERVSVTGSLKSARASTAKVEAPRWLGGDRAIFIAASTHDDEEQLVLDACKSLWKEPGNLLLLIAPRRPERFNEVARLLFSRTLSCERRSEKRGAVSADTRVVLLDTLGELPDCLPYAVGVFVGGTVAPVGGHNILEPALAGKPVAFGPHTENVAEAAAALLAADAAILVNSSADLENEWRHFLRDRSAAVEKGKRAREVTEKQTGVMVRVWEMIKPLIDR
jgi:3-deoxy-D-manno-octulosonic-acid transferase